MAMLGTLALRLSERFAWICLALLLILGLPLFLCMPLWCDVTLYDVAARNVMDGGVHYRDVFDTNMPGVVWVHVLVRSLAGWSTEAMRLFDAGVVTAVILLLCGTLSLTGVARAGRVWFAAGVVLFYLFQPEICHCQRDLWMLLPVLLALRVRCERLDAGDISPRRRLALAALEGCLWGMGIWIKPHVLIPTFAVWLGSTVWIGGPVSNLPPSPLGGEGLGVRGNRHPSPQPLSPEGRGGQAPDPGSLKRLVVDTLGLVLGGVLVGAAGVCWMLHSGTWAPFWDVFLHWNPHYWAMLKAELPSRYLVTFLYFPPWSLLHLLALPLALANLVDARFWHYRPLDAILRTRAVLAALYLGWMAQGLYLQQPYEYIHVPETILALALVTAQGWPAGLAYLAWFAGAAAVCGLASLWLPANSGLGHLREQRSLLMDNLLPMHPLASAERLQLWPRCWREASSPELRDRLAFKGGTHPSTSWTELAEVAEYLRRQGLTDGEVVCWHDTTHPLYLMLGLKPAIRFMHVGTVLMMKEHYGDVRQDLLAAPKKKFVVSDLVRVLWSAEPAAQDGPAGPLDLPPALGDRQRHVFPFDQPIVFRSSKGRYLVHRIEKPIEPIRHPGSFFGTVTTCAALQGVPPGDFIRLFWHNRAETFDIVLLCDIAEPHEDRAFRPLPACPAGEAVRRLEHDLA